MSYYIAKTVDLPFDLVIDSVIAELSEQGFGILSDIDIGRTLEEKTGEPFRPYRILGACNPPLAHKALSARPDAGLMLPCNVIVEEIENGTLVRIVDPAAMMQAGDLDGDPVLKEVGGEAEARLKRVAEALQR